jgi:succinate dehydrogenase/fumarate reductase flavoprotein subunit
MHNSAVRAGQPVSGRDTIVLHPIALPSSGFALVQMVRLEAHR